VSDFCWNPLPSSSLDFQQRRPDGDSLTPEGIGHPFSPAGVT